MLQRKTDHRHDGAYILSPRLRRKHYQRNIRIGITDIVGGEVVSFERFVENR